MKSTKLLIGVALIGLLLTYSGCGKDSGPSQSEQDKQVVKLKKTWKCTGATVDNAAPSGLPAGYSYTSLVLTIDGTAGKTTLPYTATGRPSNGGSVTSPWPASGNFELGSTDFATVITRDDGLPINYSVTETTLVLNFSYQGTGFPGSRVDNVKGAWVFTFAAQ
ncbi:MAG: hypothetical protein HOP08_19480 [Cyclobacteriaceae bacterium]|nr:hypothetical protein [Cyclobacteriaceae bacterium]